MTNEVDNAKSQINKTEATEIRKYKVLISINGVYEVFAENQIEACIKAAKYEEILRLSGNSSYEIIGVESVKDMKEDKE